MGRQQLPRYWPSVAVGAAVTLAVTVAFANVIVGLILGASAGIVMAWEQRHSGT
jgi:ABC-type dipeptide/oligopeptide/nickel transport system permease subunit